MSSEIKADLIKDKSGTKTLATLSSSAVTLHGDVGFASGYPFAQYEILEGYIGTSWTQMTLSDDSSGVKYEYGGIDLDNSNNDITVPSTGMYEINWNYYIRDNDLNYWVYWKINKHTTTISTESTGTQIFFNGHNHPKYNADSDNRHQTINAKFYYSLTANDHISMWTQCNTALDQQENPATVNDAVLKSYVSVRKIFDL